MKQGIELQAKYSFPPNLLGYCGPRSFCSIYDLYKKGEIDIWDLKKELEKFFIPMSYLTLIANSNKKESFDYEVVEAFWIGNSLLKNISHESIKELIEKDLVNYGLKKNRAIKLANNLPKGLLPNHLFHVLYIQFITEKVKKHLGNFDRCRIGWGKIRRTGDKYLTLEYNGLRKRKGEYYIGKGSKKVRKSFVKNPAIRDFVSTHWNNAIQKLTNRQVKNLEYYTNWNLNILNKNEL